MNKLVIGLLVGVILIMAVGFAFMANKVDRLQDKLTEQRLEANQAMEQRFQQLAESRRDTLLIIERRIGDIKKERQANENLVLNTRDVDSLIQQYWRFRTDLSP